RDQRRLAADAVAVMAEDRSPQRPRREADEVGAERQQRGGGRIRVREIKLAEHQSRGGAVEEEIVPFDGGADRGSDHRLAQFAAVVGLGKRAVVGYGSHVRVPPLIVSAPRSGGCLLLRQRIDRPPAEASLSAQVFCWTQVFWRRSFGASLLAEVFCLTTYTRHPRRPGTRPGGRTACFVSECAEGSVQSLIVNLPAWFNNEQE